MTRCKFSNRRDLWRNCTLSPVLGQPKFGSIMSRERFEIIRKFLQFSQDKTDHCYTEKTQWSLCEEFVEAINAHRREHVIPSHFLCVDESMSRWYGVGGSWIDVGCPHYVKLERKPENGMEIRNVACAKSWIMLGLKLVKSAKESDTVPQNVNWNNGPGVLLELCKPWSDRERIVCADSHFASVEASEVLFENNLRFIGVVKTATKRFPVRFFGSQRLYAKRDFKNLESTVEANGENKKIVAVCWLDRNRRNFIATAGRVETTVLQQRMRWRQHENGACPVDIGISMPEMIADYFAAAGVIDSHNRLRQDSLDLEKSVEVKEWSFRINCTLLGIVLTDCYLLYRFGNSGRDLLDLNSFWVLLCTAMVQNSFDVIGTCRASHVEREDAMDEEIRTDGSGIYLSPTKQRRRTSSGEELDQRKQGLCFVCPKGKK